MIFTKAQNQSMEKKNFFNTGAEKTGYSFVK